MTPERRTELQSVLSEMSAASGVFYAMAVRIGCHTWIEFTGLLNEYVNICRNALERGIDFTETNNSNGTLPIASYQAAYIGEKMECIFGTGIGRDPVNRQTFLDVFLRAVP